MNGMQALMRAIQRAASPAVWSQGVQLSRQGAVVAPSAQALKRDEVEVQVALPGGGAAVWVTLWPEDAEWSCGCAGQHDVCSHAAAAAIACNQVAAGKVAAAAQAPVHGHVAYHFTAEVGGLALAREVVGGARSFPVGATLAVAQRASGNTLITQPSDVTIDTLLSGRPTGALGQALLARILAALIDTPHVHLAGRPVGVGEPQAPMVVALSRRPGGGILVRLRPNKALGATFANGAGVFGTTLRPLQKPQLPSGLKAALTAGLVYGPEREGELMGQVLPDLAKQLPIDWGDVTKLQEVRERPALHLALSLGPKTAQGEHSLQVLPTLVYGNPPLARVIGDGLRALAAVLPKRLKDAETALATTLARTTDLRVGHRFVAAGPRGVALAAQLRALQRSTAGTQMDDPSDVLALFRQVGPMVPRLAITPGGDAFALDFVTEGHPSGGQADASAVQAALARGDTLVPLLAGGFGALPKGWLAEHHTTLQVLLEARTLGRQLAPSTQPTAGLPAWALPHLAALAQAMDVPMPQALQSAITQLAPLTVLPDDKTPQEPFLGLPPTVRLRPYQTTGIRWMRDRLALGVGALLADDMGLGKTLQALLARQGRTLIVAPTSVVPNWAEEAARMQPQLRVNVYHGPNRTLDPQAEITLTTYGMLRQDLAVLQNVPWDTLILDEAQTIKNSDSKVTQAAYALGQRARGRLALTGTPVENRLEELYSQMHFLNPGMLGSRAHFATSVVGPIAQAAATPDAERTAEGQAAAKLLRHKLAPVLLRRTKKEVATDLPQRTDVVLRCTLSADERAVYQAVQGATQANVVQMVAQGGSVMQVLEALLRLRQAACHSGLVPGHTAATSSKIELLMATLQEAVAEGHRALVFSQWTGLLDRVEPHLRQAQMGFVRLDGSTPDRGAVVRQFVADDGPPVMLISLRAGGVGLNLTAADHVFLLDPWWNPAVEDQAADRAHRIGQERPVLVHRLVAQDTVEENILRLQTHKRALAQAALNDDGALLAGGGQATGLTREDLLAMIGG